MTASFDLDDPGEVARWHRRGQIRFAIASAIMLTATIVTGTVSLAVVGVLVGAGCVAAAVIAVLAHTGLAAKRWTLLLWPVATCSTLSVLHTVAGGTAALLFGLIVLAFQFIGITQPRGRGLWFIVPASVLFLQLTGLDAKDATVRLPIAILVWLVVSEAPARLLGELRDKQGALEKLATTDSLTGLLNRSRLDAYLDAAGPTGAVALIDLDNFKEFNDIRGHVAGDLALTDFAEVLRTSTRTADHVFRYGGEEFLVIFPRTTSDEAAVILDRFAEVWLEQNSGVTFSAGISEGGPDAVHKADTLLYQAKGDGRARVLTTDRAR